MASATSTKSLGLMNGAVTTALLLLSLTSEVSRAQAPPAGGFVAGTREMFALNLSSAPPGQLPKGFPQGKTVKFCVHSYTRADRTGPLPDGAACVQNTVP